MTRSAGCFYDQLYLLFYPQGTKVVPHNLYDLLRYPPPLGGGGKGRGGDYETLAHRIMGDGTLANNAIVIQVQSFSIQDIVKIINVLYVKFGLVCSAQKQRDSYVLYINVESSQTLAPYVRPYFCSSMLYKLSA
jgi:hypothetical protein